MTVEMAIILIVGTVVPILTGLLLPLRPLRWFGLFWTYVPPVALTVHYMTAAGDQGYSAPDGFVGTLFIFLFILVWPWMIWSRTVFRLLTERRAGMRHEPPRFLMRP